MGFWAYIMEKIQGLVGMRYQLQSKNTAFLIHLFNEHVFLDPNFDKVKNLMKIIIFEIADLLF